MLSAKKIKEILQEQKLAPKKRFGQNFLINKNISEKIVKLAGISPDDTIIELGVGFGALTSHLAGICKKVIGLEIDSGIIRYHGAEGSLPENVTLVHQDILLADFTKLAEESGGRIKIIANLPYSISNPLLFKLTEHKDKIEWAVLMLQKEVAQRLTAAVGTKDYGILSVRMAACASVKKLLDLGPQHFHPRPKVDSQVVKIIFFPEPERAATLPDYDKLLFKKIVDAAFQQRRKTLINALAASDLVKADKKTLERSLEKMGLDTRIRGERLSVENFAALTNILQQKIKIDS
ncbi:MAG: dimethyladenosine transferase [Desulfobacterales bacterium SG8_35]|nr:MAG: dimethyladenosine transferase [Desulfobacterales bacterium SG8_35]